MVLAELTVLAPGGVEEVAGDDYIEYAIYGAEGELPDLGEVRAASGEGLVEVLSSEVADDWAERWRAFHRPLLIGGPDSDRAIWLRPPWEPAREEMLEVVVDPDQAFGTGAHPTTRLCVEALIRIADGCAGSDPDPATEHSLSTGTDPANAPDLAGGLGPLTDLGSGSGVLAIAASKLGWSPVYGCDHEVAAVEASTENAAVNGVNVTFERLDLKADLPPLAATTVANLTATLLLEVAARLTTDNLPRTLICSGLLTTEYERVTAAFAPFGLLETGRGRMKEWGSLILENRGS